MSDNEFIAEDDTTEQDVTPEPTSGSALRKFGVEQKKRADDLARQLEALKGELDKRKADDVFAKLGVPEKVRRLYNGEYTDEAIAAWVKEYGEVFGITAETEQTPEQTQQRTDLEQVNRATLMGQDRPTALSREAMRAMSGDLMSKGASLEDMLGKLNVPSVPLQGPMM